MLWPRKCICMPTILQSTDVHHHVHPLPMSMQCGECPTNMASITRPFILDVFSGSAHSMSFTTNSYIFNVRCDVPLPPSCFGQPDGHRWLKLLDGDEYPAVHQKLSVFIKLSKTTSFEHVVLQHAALSVPGPKEDDSHRK